MKLKWFTRSLVFNTFLCWLIILSPVIKGTPAEDDDSTGTCELQRSCENEIELDANGNVLFVRNCWGEIITDNTGSTQNQNSGSNNSGGGDTAPSEPQIDYGSAYSPPDLLGNPNWQYAQSCSSCSVGSLSISDAYGDLSGASWQDYLTDTGITTFSALLPPSDPLIITPPQSFSSPQATATPWMVQTVSLGGDFWGAPIGDLAFAADPDSDAPLTLSDVKLVLNRASNIFDVDTYPAFDDINLDLDDDGIADCQQTRHVTATAYFVVQANFTTVNQLKIMGYDLSQTETGPGNWPRPVEGAEPFVDLTFLRGTFEGGGHGIQVTGTQSDGTNIATVNIQYSAAHLPGTGTVQTVVENGVRTEITDSFVESLRDADGWQHVKDTVVSQPGEEPDTWVEWRHSTQVWRTLFNGREVLVEVSTTDASGTLQTTRYFYEEEFAFGGVRNKAFGKIRGKIMANGYWEGYDYDVATGLPYRTYKPWGNSLPPNCLTLDISDEPLSNYAATCKVEQTVYDPTDEYKTSWKKIHVLGNLVQETTTVFTEDENYTDANLNTLWTKAVTDSESGETTYTTFLRDPDGKRKTLSTRNAAGIETRYETQKGVVSQDGLSFSAETTGTCKADFTTGPLTSAGNAVSGKTKRNVTVQQANGSTLLSYTEVATVSGPLAQASFQRVEGRVYSYDSEYRLTGISLLDGTPVETHGYTATSHTVTDAEGIVQITELDGTTGKELSKVRPAVSYTVGQETYHTPELRDTVAVATDENNNVVVTQMRVGTQNGQNPITTSHSSTRNALGQIIAKTDQAGRVTEYHYSEDGQSVDERSPEGDMRYTIKNRDGQLLGVEDANQGSPGTAQNYYYTTLPGRLVTTIFNRPNRHSPDFTSQRVIIQRFPRGQVISDITTTKHPVTGSWMTASAQTTEFSNDASRASARIDASGVVQRMIYNELGELEVSGIDVDRDGELEADSTDIYTETKTETVHENGAWWDKTTTRRLSVDGDANTALVTTYWRKLGIGTAYYMRTVEPDGTEFVSSTSIDRVHATRTVTQTVTRPNGGTPLVSTQLYVNGLLVAETRPGVNGTITYAYDGLERRVTVIDPRSGTLQWSYLPDGRLEWTKDAANNQTSYAYYPEDGARAGRLQTVTYPDNTTATYDYDIKGRTVQQGGTSAYPVAYEYDEWGKMKKMKTWRDPEGEPDVTTWLNDPFLGVLEKTDAANQTVRYSFYPGGALHIRTWARGVTTTYGYDNAGRLSGVDYSDATPDVSTSYDRLNRPVTISDGSGGRTQTYGGPGGVWDTLNYAADCLLGAVSVERGFDTQMREDELKVVQGGEVISGTSLGYHDATGRIGSISHGGNTATYDWTSTVAGLPVGISYSGAGLVGTRTPDAEGRLDKIVWSLGNANALSHDYTLDSRGRRTEALREDGTHWDYGYNDRGEVTSASHERSDNTPLPGRGFGYTFDAIGNRTGATVAPHSNGGQAMTYTPNALNQYTHITRTNPLQLIVQGLAHPDATVEVRHDSPTGESRTVARVEPNGAGFIAEAEADTALAGVWRQVVVDAQRPGVGVNGGPVRTRRKGWLFFPPQNETLVYDEDGNLKEDARWLYTWDGENRLTAMEEKQIANATPGETPPPRKRLEFAYDGQSRRVRKVVKTLHGQTWSVTSDLRFVYDAWNLLAEFSMKLETSNLELQRSYAWGYDLSGTEQGAGGVGGLVLVKQSQTTANNGQPPQTGALAPLYDGNGNILSYLDCTTGTITQRMEYDAFGNEMTLDSVLEGGASTIREVPFRFSTKFTDSETSLSYYGYRYYSAEMGRWLNRDPSGEYGGVNLLAAISNDLPNRIDFLGLNDYGSSSTCLRCEHTGAKKVVEIVEGWGGSALATMASGNTNVYTENWLICQCQYKCDGNGGGVSWGEQFREMKGTSLFAGGGGGAASDPDLELARQTAQQVPFIFNSAANTAAGNATADFNSRCASRCSELARRDDGG